MKIDILKLREGPIAYDVDLSPDFIADGSEGEMEFDAARGEVLFRMVRQEIVAEGVLRGCVRSRCARCLERAAIPLEAKVHLYFWPKGEERVSKIKDIEPHEPDFGFYSGVTLDPDEDLREILLVEVPPVFLCSEKCKGLCPECGANLNKETCKCHPAGGDDADSGGGAAWKRQLRALKIPPGK